MKLLFLACVCLCLIAYAAASQAGPGEGKRSKGKSGKLPSPRKAGTMSLEEAIAKRRSVRDFATTPLTLDELSQLCWAGQGVTDKRSGLRAAPSAGALYPLELYVVQADGVFHYRQDTHTLEQHTEGDLRTALQAAALDQEAVGDAPACLIITGAVEVTSRKYGARAERYCHMEAGHVCQNILLQATALGLAGVPIGAYDDNRCAATLKLPQDRRVLYLLPIGHPQ